VQHGTRLRGNPCRWCPVVCMSPPCVPVARIAADTVTVNRLRYIESDFAPSGHETARPNVAECAENPV
jgi:hypothetical protein